MKISAYDFDNMNKLKKTIAINDKNNDVVNLSNYDQEEKNTKNKNKTRFFWPNITDK